eukprot:190475-Karenia_brevis.AAC.1
MIHILWHCPHPKLVQGRLTKPAGVGQNYLQAHHDTIIDLVPYLPSPILLGHTPYLQAVPHLPFWSDCCSLPVDLRLTPSQKLFVGICNDTIDLQKGEWLATFTGSHALHHFQMALEETFDGDHPLPSFVYREAPEYPD